MIMFFRTIFLSITVMVWSCGAQLLFSLVLWRPHPHDLAVSVRSWIDETLADPAVIPMLIAFCIGSTLLLAICSAVFTGMYYVSVALQRLLRSWWPTTTLDFPAETRRMAQLYVGVFALLFVAVLMMMALASGHFLFTGEWLRALSSMTLIIILAGFVGLLLDGFERSPLHVSIRKSYVPPDAQPTQA